MQMSAKTSWATALVIAGLAVSFVLTEILFGHDRARLALETHAVMEGQVYRLITGHFAHISRHHTILSIASVLLVGVLLFPVLRPSRLLATIAASLCAISFGWMILQPGGITYVGFSGIVHGLLGAGALLFLRDGPKWLGWALFAGLAVKLGFESLQGPVPGVGEAIAGRVSTLSHALGALGGIFIAPWHPGAKPVLLLVAMLAVWAALRHEALLVDL